MSYGDWFLRFNGVELLRFGSSDSELPLTVFPDINSPGLERDDSPRPRTDGMAFGQDFERGTVIKFDVRGDGYTIDQGLEISDRFLSAWRNPAIRMKAGAVAELESPFNGRVCYGRPRRSMYDDYLLRRAGIVDIRAEFDMITSLWFGQQNTVTLDFVPSDSGGGFVFPLVFPMVTSQPVDRSVAVNVGGSMPTWPVVRINGPITSPSVLIGGDIMFTVPDTLDVGEYVEIDTRPWNRSVLKNGSSDAGVLTASSTLLKDASLVPGNHEVILRGTSAQGTASTTVTWRDAYSRY